MPETAKSVPCQRTTSLRDQTKVAPTTNRNAVLSDLQLIPIGYIRSSIKTRAEAPRQGIHGGPDAWVEVDPEFTDCLDGLAAGHEIVVVTWLHQGKRDVRKVRPQSVPNSPIMGVFATRSPDRPNPLGLHQVTVREIHGLRLRIGPMEAIDGTPVVDIKPVLCAIQKS